MRRLLKTARLGLVVLSLTTFASTSAFAQSDDDKASARALAQQGSDALKANKFAEALDLVSRAEALVHAPPHLLMIARAQVGLGRLVAAKETYLKIMREDLPATAPAAFKKAIEDAKAEEPLIEPKIGSLKVVLENVKDRKVTLKIDEQPVPAALIGVHRPMDPGKHEIVGYPVGLSPVKASIVLKEGEKQEVSLKIPDGAPGPGVPIDPTDNPDANKPPPVTSTPDAATPTHSGSSTGRKVLGFGAIGLGVVGGVLGGVFMGKRGSDSSSGDDLYNQCKPHCTAAQRTTIESTDSSAATDGTIAAIGLIGGGAAIVTGVVILLTGGSSSSEPKKARIEPWIAPRGLGLRGAF